jgi:catechol 2,3-dioxygenase-like lactoylglutathione lyase family enzyme
MPLLNGLNHVAVLTGDLNRFTDFYTNVFGMEVVFSESSPGFRHSVLRIGPDSWLHPAEITGNAHASALPAMFTRGHLDHIALTAASQPAFEELRSRLIERGASDGAVETLGAFHSLWFEDPDGMHAELILIINPALRHIHAPRQLTAVEDE